MSYDRLLGPVVREVLDECGFSSTPIFYGQLPDLPLDAAVLIAERAGAPSDLAAGYEFPAFVVTVRAREHLVAELVAAALHYELHGRDYIPAADGTIWTLLARGSPQLSGVRNADPRYEWTFELTSMMDR